MTHPAESDARWTNADRERIHRHHAVPVNADWRTCPLCPPIWGDIDAIVRDHVSRMTRVIPPAEPCVCDAFDYEAEGPCRVPGHDSRVAPIPPAKTEVAS